MGAWAARAARHCELCGATRPDCSAERATPVPTQPQAMMPTRLSMFTLLPQAFLLTSAMSSAASSAMRMAAGADSPRGMLAQYIAGMIRATPQGDCMKNGLNL